MLTSLVYLYQGNVKNFNKKKKNMMKIANIEE